jgi:hypothetical protein
VLWDIQEQVFLIACGYLGLFWDGIFPADRSSPISDANSVFGVAKVNSDDRFEWLI